MSIVNANIKANNGMALISGLLFLIIITILVISVISVTVNNEKQAKISQNINISFQAAESSLRDAENWLNTQAIKPIATTNCSNIPCDVWANNMLPNLIEKDHSWWLNNSRHYSSSITYGISSQPGNFIEEQYFIADDLNPNTAVSGSGLYYYQVTSRGTASDDATNSIVQSTFATRFD